MSDQATTPIINSAPQASSKSADRAVLMSNFRDIKSKLEAVERGDISKLDLPIEHETLPQDEREKNEALKVAELIDQLLEIQYELQSDQAAGPKGRKTPSTKSAGPKVSSKNEIKIVANNNLLDDL